MHKDRDETFDRDQPTLFMTYGTAPRKLRPLDRDVLLIGNGPGCDVHLKSADVAPVHCLLVRGANGWRLRNVSGRATVQLNGRPVVDEALDHDDTLQIGPFSFKLHLPPQDRRPDTEPQRPAVDAARFAQLQRSRRNLVRLGLNLRRRYLETAAAHERAEKQSEQQQQDLDQIQESARARQNALDALRTKQEAEQRAFQAHCQAWEEREAALAESIRAAQERLARHETLPAEEARRLEIRAVELAYFASHLRRLAVGVAEQNQENTRRAEELAWEREQLRHEREQLHRQEETRPEPAQALAPLSRLRKRLARVQELKNNLASLRTSDSAPGVTRSKSAPPPHRTDAPVEKENRPKLV